MSGTKLPDYYLIYGPDGEAQHAHESMGVVGERTTAEDNQDGDEKEEVIEYNQSASLPEWPVLH